MSQIVVNLPKCPLASLSGQPQKNVFFPSTAAYFFFRVSWPVYFNVFLLFKYLYFNVKFDFNTICLRLVVFSFFFWIRLLAIFSPCYKYLTLISQQGIRGKRKRWNFLKLFWGWGWYHRSFLISFTKRFSFIFYTANGAYTSGIAIKMFLW